MWLTQSIDCKILRHYVRQCIYTQDFKPLTNGVKSYSI